MVLLYNLAIRAYYLLILLLSPFHRKAKLWIAGRREWDENLESNISPNHPTAWFHCASLGEFEQGRPLIEAYRDHYPGHKVLVTFFSPSGYEIRKNYAGADYVCYLPLDTRRNAKKFISIVKPVVVIFVKYEFWYHFLNQLGKNEIPTYIVSSIFRPSQVFFKWYGGWYRKFLKNFKHIFVQNKQSLVLLQSIGLDNATAAGDTRFDRVWETASNVVDFPLIEEFAKDAKVLIAGSTWPRDDEIISDYMRRNKYNIKLILAPHEIDHQRIERFIKKLDLPAIVFTRPIEVDAAEAQVLVIDTIGILSSAYSYADIAYIGGGFGVGIHNTLEAATFGIPVIFGPNYQKFREARELIDLKAAYSISNEDGFRKAVNDLLEDEDKLKESGSKAKKYIQTNTGATSKILGMISPKIRTR